MHGKLVIHTALIICLAFVVRIFFTHVGVITSSNGQVNAFSQSHYTGQEHAKLSSHAEDKEYVLAEVFEEDPDEQELKNKLAPARQILYAISGGMVSNDHRVSHAGYRSFSYNETPLYLALQVFRI